MSEKTDKDDPVFPITDTSIPGQPCFGLTKREYFAAMALQGICANDDLLLKGEIEKISVEIADDLILALNRRD